MATSCGPRFLSILRLVAGLLFLEHGLSKLTGFPHPGGPEHLPTLLVFAALIETIGGVLLSIGLFTRVCAFIMSGEMMFAYFMRHLPNGFYPQNNGGEAAVLFCFIFFYFFLVGGGEWSIDRWFRRVEV